MVEFWASEVDRCGETCSRAVGGLPGLQPFAVRGTYGVEDSLVLMCLGGYSTGVHHFVELIGQP